MEKYLEYSLEQLLWDDSFRKLILNPTGEEELAKKNWLASNPEKAGILLEAEDIIRSVQPEKSVLSENDRLDAVGQIFAKTSRKSVKSARMISVSMLLRVAASIVLAAGLFLAGKKILNRSADFPEMAGKEIVRRENNSNTSQLIRLEDGSSVVLKSGSYITFPKHFNAQKREVKLNGEAFFEISRNPDRPFFVYAGKSVTKVLGTSFNVRAFEADDAITVLVKTGKVAVYFTDNSPEKNSEKPISLLEPNEQIVLNKQDNTTLKSHLISESGDRNQSEMLKEISVSEIFAGMQKLYGVDIEFDQDKLKNCAVMANLEDLHLLEKLDAICLAINATYTISEGKVKITGQGC